MGITKKAFGTTAKGEEAVLITLENSNGMKVSLSDFGAVIVNIIVADAKGEFADIALGFDSVTGYEKNAPFFGAFIGRHANRIGGACFTLNGTEYNNTEDIRITTLDDVIYMKMKNVALRRIGNKNAESIFPVICNSFIALSFFFIDGPEPVEWQSGLSL